MPISDPVTLRHPDLPDVEITRHPTAAVSLKRRGWVDVAEQVATTEPVDESPQGDEPQPPSEED